MRVGLCQIEAIKEKIDISVTVIAIIKKKHSFSKDMFKERQMRDYQNKYEIDIKKQKKI